MLITKKFEKLDEANFWCAGGILGGADPGHEIGGLVGQTITFTSPVGSCTFTEAASGNASPGKLRFADIKAQMEAAIANLVVLTLGKKIGFKHVTPGTACTMGAVSQGGRVPLGFPNNEAVTGLVIAKFGGTDPSFQNFVTELGAVYITYNV